VSFFHPKGNRIQYKIIRPTPLYGIIMQCSCHYNLHRWLITCFTLVATVGKSHVTCISSWDDAVTLHHVNWFLDKF